jgi:hypothetical protein
MVFQCLTILHYFALFSSIVALTNQTSHHMGQPNSILVFALGCIGALSPEVVRLYKLRHRPLKKFSSYYYAASGVYACLGGVVAVVLPSVTVWAAFYAGVTWPTLISTITHHQKKSRTMFVANQRGSDNIIKATDKSDRLTRSMPESGPVELKASRARISPLKTFKEFIQNHADGLFE